MSGFPHGREEAQPFAVGDHDFGGPGCAGIGKTQLDAAVVGKQPHARPRGDRGASDDTHTDRQVARAPIAKQPW